ncbi:hypothetical protein BC332_04015 [Capsicum chinense]|nr:hypothetical protein BC332_04015 [Capsicum chinense]
MIESNKKCDDLCAMFLECNLTGNSREWWMDYGATLHVCANKEFFSSFSSAQVEEMIYMANSATVKIEGTGKLCLKMTSGKVLTVNNVLAKPAISRKACNAAAVYKFAGKTFKNLAIHAQPSLRPFKFWQPSTSV